MFPLEGVAEDREVTITALSLRGAEGDVAIYFNLNSQALCGFLPAKSAEIVCSVISFQVNSEPAAVFGGILLISNLILSEFVEK